MGRLRHTVGRCPDRRTTAHLDADSLGCELTALLDGEVIYSNRMVAVCFRLVGDDGVAAVNPGRRMFPATLLANDTIWQYETTHPPSRCLLLGGCSLLHIAYDIYAKLASK